MRKELLALIALVLLASFALYPRPQNSFKVSTTTSLYDTGLLDVLAKAFEEKYGAKPEFLVVGSGQALRLAKDGAVCLTLVHAPSLEKQYSEYLTDHIIFAYNYFVIVGPKEDPAGVKDARNATEAFRKIYEAGEAGKALFVSRGDMSGTHVKELSLWKLAGLDPKGRPWYKETGSGMAKTLIIANNMKAYTLSDVSTFLKLKRDGKLPNLEILYSGSEELINIYSGYRVKGCEDPNAKEFLRFLNSTEGQKIIASYGKEEFGRPLFYPAEGKLEWLREVWRELAR
ncbi:MAG: solute-binding protein [Crenarchaeota archaeon]|nr:solute-binding protein [Thermoproteota archaeon]